jgi:hypothetical protein
MRILFDGFLACNLIIVAASGAATADQPLRPQEVPTAQIIGPHVPRSPDIDKVIAGLSRSSRPEVLTWERVYALALVRAGTRRATFAERLDPASLTEDAARQGVGDFERFRTLFLAAGLATGDRSFRDPSASVLDLACRLQTIHNARQNVALHENLDMLLRERTRGEASGLNQLDVDRVHAASVRVRQKSAQEIARYRAALDDLKVALGLSPRAAVILDPQALAAFRAVFDSVDDWTRSAQRNLTDLHAIVDRLPAPGDVVLDGKPILARIENDADCWEEVLTAAARLAIRNRSEWAKGPPPGDAAIQLELRVRRLIRSLFETRRAYEEEKRSCELAIRQKDQAFERLLAPSAGGVMTSRSPLLVGLLDQVSQVFEVQDRLVALWTSFRAERLALYRKIGVLPYNDWSAFYADLSAAPAAAVAVPAVVPKPSADRPEPGPPTPPVPPGL